MGINSLIQWTDNTHNFWEGCKKVDADCKFCYAERMFSRFGKDFSTIRRVKNFDAPLKWKEPKKIFTCSTSDFFIDQADSYRNEAWDIIRKCPQHTFQILTKRPERIADHLPSDWGKGWDNVWLGTSVGSQESANKRLLWLNSFWAKVKFVSVEPLHGPVSFQDALGDTLKWHCGGLKNCVSWVIVGGESGNENGKYRYRPCSIEWMLKIIADCIDDKVPVFVKQLGTHLAKELKLKDRHGGNITEWPEELQIREFPNIH